MSTLQFHKIAVYLSPDKSLVKAWNHFIVHTPTS